MRWATNRCIQWIRIGLLCQLAIGTVVVTVHSQPTANAQAIQQAVIAERLADQANSISERVSRLENMRIAERLAVLDDMYARQTRVELLAYGQIFTLVVLLVMGLVKKPAN